MRTIHQHAHLLIALIQSRLACCYLHTLQKKKCFELEIPSQCLVCISGVYNFKLLCDWYYTSCTEPRVVTSPTADSLTETTDKLIGGDSRLIIIVEDFNVVLEVTFHAYKPKSRCNVMTKTNQHFEDKFYVIVLRIFLDIFPFFYNSRIINIFFVL